MSRMVLVVILIMSVVGIASACSCQDFPLQKRFCSTQFAGVFYIEDSGTVIGGQFGHRKYKVELIHMYRTVQGPTAEPGYLYTPAVACGVTLIEGKYYVIAGYYDDFGHPIYHRMKTSLCDVQLEFSYNPIYTFEPPECEDLNETVTY